MSETVNCKLHLTDDDSERFQDWRKAMNGPDNSNMVKIDAAIGKKADKSEPVFTVLYATAWVGADAPYTQTVTIPGLGVDDNGLFDIAHSATSTQRDIARYALLSIVDQEDETLTFVADGELPEQDIPICVVIFG